MKHQHKPTLISKRLLLASLAVLIVLSSESALARGRKGGGAAGALGDFDLFPQLQVTNGLPANLVNGYAPAGGTPGDATTGVGGILQFNQQPVMIVSQGGQAITLLPNTSGTNNGSGKRAGFVRQVGPDGLPPMLSLKSVGIPTVPGLSDFIRNPEAAIRLGKALFWDIQAGSDGNACASCHFHAGADNRMKNQLSPGLNAGDSSFQMTSNGKGGPNYTLKPGDFPFHQLTDPLDRNSEVLYDSNDVVSSQGAFGGVFKKLGQNGAEICGARTSSDSFNVNGVMTRRVPGRNAPSTINAIFNYRNFWDGRANNSFNGVSPFGPRDNDARVLEVLSDGSTQWTKISLTNASLASQAVGPVLSEFEMSCANRTFKDMGRKLLALRPLRLQEIHPQDGVLGAYIDKSGKGLKGSYPEMIRAAFDSRWWSAAKRIDGYTQMEANFSLYWGLAIMMYESTLVSDETPFDKFVGSPGSPPDVKALTPQQLRGLGVFRGNGLCISCHKGAEFTGAATALQRENADEGTLIESMFLKTADTAIYDNGFYNIGVRPTVEDRGVGGSDPFGYPLSYSRNWFEQLRGRNVVDSVWVDPCLFSIFFDASACWNAPDPDYTRIVVDGAFKTPGLRNIALTQPYFHNGSRYSLEQVVEYYNRGGDRRGPDDNDTTGLIATDATNGGATNVHPSISPLGLSKDELRDLVAFLRYGLTDPRVACEQAPFDHPSLPLSDGHFGNQDAVRDKNKDGLADDQITELPAVGAKGRARERCLSNDDGSKLFGFNVKS
ncbi:MAG: cytochrome-c peroxidase [Gallionella sp.]|nr:cytochrome-c peroxidase [Gallionella sp.]